MNNKVPAIVVLTPVKNEAWILDRFLSVTSCFADYIIIADQNSTDDSVNICKKYKKVVLIKNEVQGFNEAERQLMLIKAARDFVPGHKIILALDADEILAANALQTPGWKTMLAAQPGTVLHIEKVSICDDADRCIRYYPFPLGYVDDGAEHHPQKIHSVRVPTPDYASNLILHDIKILHYLLMRPEAQGSKVRFYATVENTLGKGNPFSRRITYSPEKDYTLEGHLEASNPLWFAGWEAEGIDMRTIITRKFYWYDYEVLKIFQKYGSRRFWLEDIWRFDWESFRVYAVEGGLKEMAELKIHKPPVFLDFLMRILTALYGRLKSTLIA